MASEQQAPDHDIAAATSVLHLGSSYQMTQALAVAAQLGLADLLAKRPRTIAELAEATHTHEPSLLRLMRSLAAFDIFERHASGEFALTRLGECLRADAHNSVRDALIMHASSIFWQTASDLLHCVQTGEPGMRHLFGTPNPFDYYRQHPEAASVTNAGMTAVARIIAAGVVAAYEFPESSTVVDVGGGQGLLLATILQAHSALRGILFDLPHTLAQSGSILEQAGVTERCDPVAGDMFAEVPEGGDVYILSRVLHDWDDTQALAILKSCRSAMRPQTRLLIIERVLPVALEPSRQAQLAAMSDLTMLLRTGGRERTDAEYDAILAVSGFTRQRIIPIEGGYSIIESVALAPTA